MTSKQENLVKTQLVINGEWRPSSSGMLYEVHNPANPEELVGQAARGNADDVKLAVDAAHKAFPEWSSLSHQERAEYLRKVDQSLVEDENDMPTDLPKTKIWTVPPLIPSSQNSLGG
jgi:acyl-CoA reductase-like NAD-dependent aldehyde dehydrogenase